MRTSSTAVAVSTLKGGKVGLADDLQALVREAETYFSQSDWDLALETYQKVLQLDPQNDEACSKIARVYAFRGLISNVISQYFQLLQILEERGEYDTALEVAKWVMQLQPENDKARLAQINILRKRGQTHEVVRQSLQLARLYIELGLGDESIDLLKNAQEVDPENLDIGTELAEIYVSHGHIQEGVTQFRQIANLFAQKEQYDKAADAFKRMKVIQSDDPSLLFTLGELYVKLGRLNDAEAEFRAILRHDLNHVEALLALGSVCHQKGQFRDAILAFNKIITINPDAHVAKEKLGELYHAQGNVNEAIKQYLAAALAYQQIEELPRAVILYQRVVSLDPTHPTACRELTNMGAPMEPENPVDLGPGYQPPPPAAEPEAQATGPSEGRRDVPRARSKAEAGGSALMPRESGGGKSMLPRPGLMSSKGGGGGLVAKGDGMPLEASGKRRLGGGSGGDRPTMARSRTPVGGGDGKAVLGQRRGADREVQASVEPEPAHLPQQEAHEPLVHEVPAHEAASSEVPVYEEPIFAAPLVEPVIEVRAPLVVEESSEPSADALHDAPELAVVVEEPAPVAAAPTWENSTESIGGIAAEADAAAPSEAYLETSVASRAAADAESGTESDVGSLDPTLLPSLEEPTVRVDLDAIHPEPPAPVEPPVPVAEAPPAVSSRAPLQPRLFGRGAARPAAGGKPTRPLLGGGGAGRGRGDSGKPTLPVRGARQDNDAQGEEATVLAVPLLAPPELVAQPDTVHPLDEAASVAEEIAAAGVASDSLADTTPDEAAPVAVAEEIALVVAEGETGEAQPSVQSDLVLPEAVDTAAVDPADHDEGTPLIASPSPSHAALADVAAPARMSALPTPPFDGARALAELMQAMPAVSLSLDDDVDVAAGEAYLQAGDVGKAILALRHTLEVDQASLESRGRLAELLFAHGMMEEAATEYLHMAHLDSDNVAILHRLADAYLLSDTPARAVDLLVTLSFIYRQSGDLEMGSRVLHDALTVDHKSARARLELVELYRQSEATDLASWHMRLLAQISDESSDGAASVETWRKMYEMTGSAADYERLARVLDKNGNVEEAVAAYRQLAFAARESGEVERARGFFERLAELAPSDPEVQEALLAIYQSSGDESQALEKMRSLAEASRQAGDLDAALRFYEELVRRAPHHVSDRQALVELYLDKGLINNARNEAQSLIETWYRESRLDVAIPLLQRLVEALPDDVLPREQLVHFYEKSGDTRAALEGRVRLARLHARRGSAEDALKVFQKALSVDDRNAELHFEMGLLYADQLNDPAAAEQHLLKVRALDPSHRGAMARLVGLQLAMGKAHEAIPLLADLIHLDPESASVRDMLLTDYQRRIEERPDDMQSKFTLGLLYRISGQIEDAIVLFQDTRKAHELFLHSCNMLGQCFWERRAGAPASAATEEAAVKWFKRGIEAKGYADEDYLELRYNLAEVHNHRNEVTEALKLYQDIYLVDIHFKDVAEKIKQLEEERNGGGKVTRLRTS